MTEFGSLMWGLQSGEGSTRKQTDHHGGCLRETQTCGRRARCSSCGGRSAAERLVLLERSAPSRARPRAGQQHILCMFDSVLCNNGDTEWHHTAPRPTNCDPYGLHGRVAAAGTGCFYGLNSLGKGNGSRSEAMPLVLVQQVSSSLVQYFFLVCCLTNESIKRRSLRVAGASIWSCALSVAAGTDST
jgi:hypothetical protein